MFVINDDLSIYVTRGDAAAFTVTSSENGVNHVFQPGDVVRLKVYGKKDAENIVLQKDFPVLSESETVSMYLSERDTKFGGVISKPTDYWYEVELNPFTNPQTIIGYDEDGAKVFRLYPEGADVPEIPVEPEVVKVMDDELDLTSTRPVQNQAIARAVAQINGKIENINSTLTAKTSTMSNDINTLDNEIGVERARVDNLVASAVAPASGDDAAFLEVTDIRVGADGKTYASAGTAVREQFKNVTQKNLFVKGFGSMVQESRGDFPYDDVDLFPPNSVITIGYPNATWLANRPTDTFTGTIVTFNYTGSITGGMVQIGFNAQGTTMYSRCGWGGTNRYSGWLKTTLGGLKVTNAAAIIPTNIFIREGNTEYTSFNDLPTNGAFIYDYLLEDAPDGLDKNSAGTVLAFNTNTDTAGTVQVLFSRATKTLYTRQCWGGAKEWTAWTRMATHRELQEMKAELSILSGSDVPLVASFLKIGCIGDSLASGESIYKKSDGTNGYADMYDHSWGQFMAKIYGIKCVNFSAGGLTTRSYWTHSRGWSSVQNPDNLCNAYIIGLGQNDRNNLGNAYLGKIGDVNINNADNNADSYYGNYAKIIQKIKKLQPKAKFFLLTDPIIGIDHAYNHAVAEIANFIEDCYLIDMTKYASMFSTGGFFKANSRGGHYNSIAYNYIGKIIGEEISRFMYANPDEFAQVEFIGTEYSYD